MLYTDNYYTSLPLAEELWVRYSMFLVGTMRLTTKLSRTAEDFPFHKLSPVALRQLRRGWLRAAVKTVTVAAAGELGGSCAGTMVLMALVWKDRKQVGLLSNFDVVEPTTPADGDDDVQLRRVRGQSERQRVQSHRAFKQYSKKMGAIDHVDRSVATWGSHMHSAARWYIRLFLWMFDVSMHNLWVLVKFEAMADEVKREGWQKYLKKGGRRLFQLDLAQVLITKGMELGVRGGVRDGPLVVDLRNGDRQSRPRWMRRADYVPCNCGTCYFCAQGICHGVAHPTFAKMTSRRPRPASVSQNALAHEDHVQFLKDGKPIKSRYCQVCYRRESAKNQLLPRAQRRSPMKIKDSKDVKNTCYGCAGCNCRVCHTCWATYEHDYNGAAGDAETPAPKRNRGICGSCPSRTPRR